MEPYQKLKILGSCSGAWNKPSNRSNLKYYFFSKLLKHCHVTNVINFWLPAHMIDSTMPSRVDYYQSEYYTELAKIWKKIISDVKEPYDFILYFKRPKFLIKHKTPYAIFVDMVKKDWFQSPFFIEYGLHNEKKELSDLAAHNVVNLAVKHELSLYKSAPKIFTYSEYARKCFIRDYHINPSKVTTVGAGPNFTSLPKVKRYPDGNTILFVGSDFIRKGGVVLLEAFAKVKQRIPDAKLIIVSSDAKEYDYYKGKNLEQRGVLIKGFANKRVLGYLYRRASLFVMPSLYEAFGVVFLEAMAYGLPCIGTNLCAMPEIIEDGKTGFLVPADDSSELAERIVFLLKHKRIARHMGECGRMKVEKYYNWDSVVIRILKEIRRIVPCQPL